MSSVGDQGPQLMMQDCYSATVWMHQDIQFQGEGSQQELELWGGGLIRYRHIDSCFSIVWQCWVMVRFMLYKMQLGYRLYKETKCFNIGTLTQTTVNFPYFFYLLFRIVYFLC